MYQVRYFQESIPPPNAHWDQNVLFNLYFLLSSLKNIGVSRQVVARASSTISIPVKTNDWFLFPRETEGNNYSVNWSLAEDGVTNSQDAYRNARLPILTNRLSSKVENGVVSLKKPVYTGKSQVQEAGDGISHSDFQNKFSSMQQYLSSGVTLFIEDASLGAYNKSRVGVRVISDDAGVALACRSLLVRMSYVTPVTPANTSVHSAEWRFTRAHIATIGFTNIVSTRASLVN